MTMNAPAATKHREDTSQRASEEHYGTEIRNRSRAHRESSSRRLATTATSYIHRSDARIPGITFRVSKSDPVVLC